MGTLGGTPGEEGKGEKEYEDLDEDSKLLEVPH